MWGGDLHGQRVGYPVRAGGPGSSPPGRPGSGGKPAGLQGSEQRGRERAGEWERGCYPVRVLDLQLAGGHSAPSWARDAGVRSFAET